jgi:hypothetical protein
MGVPEIEKPRGGKYADRPSECRAFLRGWLTNPRFGPEWKPGSIKDRHHGSRRQRRQWFARGWRKEPYYGDIKSLVLTK